MANPKYTHKPPQYAPGRWVAEALTEGIRLIGCESVLYTETSPVSVFQVPPDTIVLGAVAEIETAFNGTSPAVQLGDSGSATRFLNLSGTNVTTTGTRSAFVAKYYDTATTLIATLTLSGATAGKVKFWILVRTDSAKQR